MKALMKLVLLNLTTARLECGQLEVFVSITSDGVYIRVQNQFGDTLGEWNVRQ